MPLLFDYKTCRKTEDEMQKEIADFLTEYKFFNNEKRTKGIVLREVHIPSVHRRSDIIVKRSQRIYINIECKLSNVESVIKQAEDHLLWANYSYIAMPKTAYIPVYKMQKLIDLKIGLILWCQDTGVIIESLHAPYKSQKKNPYRQDALSAISKMLSKTQPLKLDL